MIDNRAAALDRILASEGNWRDTRDKPEGEGEPGGAWSVENGLAGTFDLWRGLLRLRRPLANWRMDDALLKSLNSRDAKTLVTLGCDVRWAQMQLRPDFSKIGKGLAFRVSEVHRGALEMIGFAPEPPRYAVPMLTPPA